MPLSDRIRDQRRSCGCHHDHVFASLEDRPMPGRCVWRDVHDCDVYSHCPRAWRVKR